ncbi:MAG: endonuclease, partial [Clostridia bacterium]|nr:endonuclease [Clostridia bacterium]
SPNAIKFYNDNQVTLEYLLSLSGGDTTAAAPSSQLYKELKTLMISNHSHQTSYQETRPMYQYTDCQNSGENGDKISSFYSGKEVGPAWDSGSTWNREHVWPNSKGLNGNDENDIMMLRPTSVSENSSRGNKAYGKSSGYYDPNKESGGKHNLHGDVARIVLYQYVRWGNTAKMWGSSGVIESLSVLLEWMEEDPVDTWELGRNDSVEAITGTRNVFVDYPELAFALFNVQVPVGYQSPSGGVSQGAPVVTAVSDNESLGTVSVRGNTITALSAPGGRIAGYEILSGSAKVTQNNNVFTVEADSDVTIKIFFETIPIFTVTFCIDGNQADSQQVYDGENIDLPSLSDKDGYTFVGWTKGNVTDITTAPEYFKPKAEFTVKQSVTLYALYSRNDGGTVYYFTVFPSDCKHPDAYETERKEPACTESGCEAGTYCPDCEKYVSGGQEIGATGHNYTTACDTVCSVCGEDNGQTPAHEYDVRNVCIHCGYSADTGDVSGEESLETSVSDSEDSKNNDISDSNSESNQTEDDGSLIRWVIPTAAVTMLVIGVTVFLITSKNKNK